MRLINISITTNNLLENIRGKLYEIGDSLKTDQTLIQSTRLQASTDDDGTLTVFINNAMDNIVSEIRNAVIDIEYVSGDVLNIILTVSGGCPSTMDKHISSMISDYFINSAMYEFMSMVYPTQAKLYFDKCTFIVQGLKHILNKRVKPIRL